MKLVREKCDAIRNGIKDHERELGVLESLLKEADRFPTSSADFADARKIALFDELFATARKHFEAVVGEGECPDADEDERQRVFEAVMEGTLGKGVMEFLRKVYSWV